MREDFDRAFEEVDLIVGPVTPTPAFKLGERIDDPLAMYLFDLYTVSTNLAGIAAMSIPCGFSSAGLPIGLHLQSPPFEEERLLARRGHVSAGDRLAHEAAAARLTPWTGGVDADTIAPVKFWTDGVSAVLPSFSSVW